MDPTQREIIRLRDEFAAFKDEVLVKLTELATLMRTREESCPYRTDIARAGNNLARLAALEEGLSGRARPASAEAPPVSAPAPTGAAAALSGAVGGVAAVAVAVVVAVGERLGWW